MRISDWSSDVCSSDLLIVADIGLEHQIDSNLFATRLQDVKQLLAANTDKSMAAASQAAIPVMDFNVVPMIERRDNLFGRYRIGLFQVIERGVGKNDPPPEIGRAHV